MDANWITNDLQWKPQYENRGKKTQDEHIMEKKKKKVPVKLDCKTAVLTGGKEQLQNFFGGENSLQRKKGGGRGSRQTRGGVRTVIAGKGCE